MAEEDSEAKRDVLLPIDEQQLKEVHQEARGIAGALSGTTEEKFQEDMRDLRERMDKSKPAKPDLQPKSHPK